MSDDALDDLEYVFLKRSNASVSAALWFVGAAVAFGFAALGMVLAFVADVTQLSLQAMTTMPILAGLAALVAGWSTAKAPSEVTVGPDGLAVTGKAGRVLTPWEQIGWATINTAPMNQKRQLVVYDVAGKAIATISEAFDDFDELAKQVRQRIADKPGDTADRLQLKKARRSAMIVGGISVLMIGVALANVWIAHEEQRTERLLAEAAVPGEADIVRRFLAPNGRTCRLEYRVTSPVATDEVRNAEVTREFWDAAEDLESVTVLVVPDEPSISRLTAGEVIDKDPTTSPKVMYVLSAVIGVICLLGLGAAVLQWRGWDIDLDSGTKKFSIKRFGAGK